MTKEERKPFEEMSLKVFGKKHAYQKLMRKGIVHEQEQVNKGGPSKPAYIARRTKLSPAGCMAYMKQTLEMQEKLKKELKEKQDAARSKSDGGSKPE